MQGIIAIIFDFDDTLAPDSTSGFLNKIGVDVPAFWRDEVQPLMDEYWDPIPAYLFKMIQLSNSGRIQPITKTALKEWGEQIEFYHGVTTVFDRLRDVVRNINSKLSLEFYMISSGIGEILKNTRIAHQFSDIWASDFAYDKNDHILFPKNIISFTDKTRYIFHVHKGLIGKEYKNKPFEVNKKFDEQFIRIPMNQMIVVGDGYTDVPCFSLVKNAGGIAIGVYDQENKTKWGRAWGFIEDGRVSNLVPSEYGEKSALVNSLTMAIESVARRVIPDIQPL